MKRGDRHQINASPGIWSDSLMKPQITTDSGDNSSGFIVGDGEMAGLIRVKDWSATPLT